MPGRRKEAKIREPEDLHEARIARPDEEIGACGFFVRRDKNGSRPRLGPRFFFGRARILEF
jgi:hypothetical protein